MFKVNIDGSGFATLHHFSDTPGPDYTNRDGTTPEGTLVVSGNTLYGTTEYGGAYGYGTAFRLNTDGTGFTNLHSFSNGDDGSNPYAVLVLADNTLYGTAQYGGTAGEGTVFKINTDGTGFTVLHSFTQISAYTNSDGAEPQTGLVLSGNTLYGTAFVGGNFGNGTVFKLTTDGSGFTTLYHFAGQTDGADPYATLALSGDTLFGTTGYAGASNFGTVFRVNTDGAGFLTRTALPAAMTAFTVRRRDRLGNLDGTAPYGGTGGEGLVFQVNTDGSGFTNLHNFSAAPGPLYTNADGTGPFSSVILSGNTLYGTAVGGGTSDRGTVFSISLGSVTAPSLGIIRAGANVVLTWPTNAAGFTLQSATNLGSPAIWTTNSTSPAMVNGLNTVTNPIAGPRQFYRLAQ